MVRIVGVFDYLLGHFHQWLALGHGGDDAVDGLVSIAFAHKHGVSFVFHAVIALISHSRVFVRVMILDMEKARSLP